MELLSAMVSASAVDDIVDGMLCSKYRNEINKIPGARLIFIPRSPFAGLFKFNQI
jgi:uncharacterized membrane protein YpjA